MGRAHKGPLGPQGPCPQVPGPQGPRGVHKGPARKGSGGLQWPSPQGPRWAHMGLAHEGPGGPTRDLPIRVQAGPLGPSRLEPRGPMSAQPMRAQRVDWGISSPLRQSAQLPLGKMKSEKFHMIHFGTLLCNSETCYQLHKSSVYHAYIEEDFLLRWRNRVSLGVLGGRPKLKTRVHTYTNSNRSII